MSLVINQSIPLFPKYWKQIIFTVIIVSTQMSYVRTLPVASTPVFISQPQYVETGMYRFLNIPVTPNQNAPTSSIFEDYTVTLLRIHKILPFNYGVATSLTGIGYYFRSAQVSNGQLIWLTLLNKLTTSFIVRGFVHYQSHFFSLSGRYMAYNTNYMRDFYLQRQKSVAPIDADFGTFRKVYYNFKFPLGTSSTTHSCHLMLEGLDILLHVSITTTAQWVTKVMPLPQPTTDYSLQVWGSGCYLWEVRYTLIFYANGIDYNSPPKYRHTKILQLPQHSCSATLPTGTCLIYDPNVHSPSFPVSDNNFMIGINYFKATNKIDFQIRYASGVIQDYRVYSNGVAYVGFLMYGYTCIDGYYLDSLLQECTPCGLKCMKCTSLLCSYCDIDYVLSADGKNCESIYTPSLEFASNCLSFNNTGDIFTCLFCNITRKLYLNNQTFQCECQSGFAFNTTSQICEDICGDGIKYQKECDDGNILNNDGCDSQCRLQVGFNCIITANPTICRSAFILKYKIDMIHKIQDEEASGLIILSPAISSMPFDIKKQNFFTNNDVLTHLDFNLILKNNLVETIYDMDFQLQKVQNNRIYLYFTYNFTVQKLNARIFLNYEHTSYMPTNQTLDFQLTGLNGKFQFTSLYQAYSTVSKGIMVTTLLGLIGLVIGLFLPKFIGIETIISLQLIFYSQILIINPEDWPVGFFYLKYLKMSTGYNDFVFLTSYFQLTNITKKFSKIFLKKTIIENFNCSFVIVIFFAFAFYLIVLIRSKMETNIETYIKVNKIQDINRDFVVKKMMKKFSIPFKINEIAYFVISQLCVWSVLPILSSVGAEFLIQNSMITLREEQYDFIFLKLRGLQFFIILFVIFSVTLNHFKNAFLSRRTLKKIQERPQELLYKQLLFIYLFVMGGLIFFFNDIKLGVIPISVIVLGLHIVFATSLLFIQPYKQSLRIHAFTLYMNQVLYGIFLIVINLINMVNYLNEAMILYIGYGITGWVGALILMTFVRLYYEIRHGEALQKQIQAQRKKQAEEEENKKKKLLQKKIDKFQKQAKQKLTKQQQKRDMNSYLLETQQKQQNKQNLLEWIEGRNNWDQQEKQRYFFKYHHEKPLQWINNKQSEQFKKRIAQIQERNIQNQRQKQKQKEDSQYIDTVDRMRKDLEQKKRLLRSFKKQARIKREQNKWIQSL